MRHGGQPDHRKKEVRRRGKRDTAIAEKYKRFTGFQPLSRAYAIPREDPTRAAVLQSAAETACTAPLEIMALCAAALSAAGRLAEIGSRLAVSDAGCAAAILRGALEAAALNVLVNTKTMTDRSAADHLNARCFALLDQGRTDGERIFCAVRDQLV